MSIDKKYKLEMAKKFKEKADSELLKVFADMMFDFGTKSEDQADKINEQYEKKAQEVMKEIWDSIKLEYQDLETKDSRK